MKGAKYLIAIACVVVGGGCLLAVHLHDDTVAKNQHAAVASAFSNASTTLLIPGSNIVPSSTPATLPKTTLAVAATSTPISFEIVTTPAAQQRGLGGRAVIPDNYAMLFVFPTDTVIGFWMKDMLTSIDMIWVDDNGNIVGVDDSVAANTYPQVFYPPVPVKYVLETKAGFAREKGWKIGMHVDLPLPY